MTDLIAWMLGVFTVHARRRGGLETCVPQFYYLGLILALKTKSTVQQVFQQRRHLASNSGKSYYLYLFFMLSCGCNIVTGVLHNNMRIICH